MKILFCGDVVGRSGRQAVSKWVPVLKGELKPDFVIVNGENGAGGFGTTKSTAKEFLDAGADVLTGGDHIWDQNDAAKLLETEPRLLRPHNFPDNSPGTGCRIFESKNGHKVMVLHLLGQVFHKEYLNSPFEAADKALANVTLGKNVDAIFVDMHAEATSEKNAMGHYLDGRVSAVLGSHTHIPTADCRILRGGTAYQTDTGMCGDYNSIIGFAPEGPMGHFIHKRRKMRMEPASGEATLCAAIIEIDNKTGLATSIAPIMRGGVLGNASH